MIIRPYQDAALTGLYGWWTRHAADEIPLIVMPTGSGKSIVIAELTRLLWDTWPDDRPRTVVLVPSKELAQQNAEKLAALMPAHISVGYYSASLGQKRQDADVIVATIGSIYRDAHLLGAIRCVIIDEAHLVNPNGVGRYRQFVAELGALCPLVAVGLTATPFRGNGVWLTDGDSPLFHGIAHEVRMQELIDAGFLAPLVRPVDAIETRIDVEGVGITNGDYRIDELAERVDRYLPGVVRNTLDIAADRRKWIAFTPNVATAHHLAQLMRDAGVSCEVVCGETPADEREDLVARFRAGGLRCLVTVLALATGFDVPDVDCVIWCRPTRSPVLYVQGAGRGTRVAPGKADCLWLDFSDTTERLGPIDAIRGRKKRKAVDQEAPYAICPECAAHVRPASLEFCPECGARMREKEEAPPVPPSNAAILSSQLRLRAVRYEISRVTYARHQKDGSPDSLRAEYWSGLRIVAREWVCLSHAGFARAKAEAWWQRRAPREYLPGSTDQAIEWIESGYELAAPAALTVNEAGRWPEIMSFEWNDDPTGTDVSTAGVAQAA